MAGKKFSLVGIGFLMGIIAVVFAQQEVLAQNFSPNMMVNEQAPGPAGPAAYTNHYSIKTDSVGNIHIAWQDYRNGNYSS